MVLLRGVETIQWKQFDTLKKINRTKIHYNKNNPTQNNTIQNDKNYPKLYHPIQ